MTKLMQKDLGAHIAALKAAMEDGGVDRITISDHMTLVKISYPAFLEAFSGRTDCTRLGSEIRCGEGDLIFSADVIRGCETGKGGGEEV